MFSMVSKGRRLLDVLAQKGAEVLNDLIRGLGKAMKRAEINKGRNGNSRTCLEIQVLFVLQRKSTI